MNAADPQYVSLKGIIPNSYTLWMSAFAVSFIIFLVSPVLKIGNNLAGLLFPGSEFVGWIGYVLFLVSLVCLGTIIIQTARPYCKVAKTAFLACLILTVLFLLFNIVDISSQVRQLGPLPRGMSPASVIGYGAFFLLLWPVFAVVALLSNPTKNLTKAS
ncbi:MAG: hypothetical protein ACOYJQ_18645 [Pseudochelatococcus sp.]|jgi:hypothetical protein|uniref:hypothetical protein n=1 Tax=Pseudochelatococcus sp. TaxID=2020869 RepID=UPI003D8F24FC